MIDEDAPKDGVGIDATVWRYLRDLYLRLKVPETVDRETMDEQMRTRFLEKYTDAMVADHRALMVIVHQGQSEALSILREAVHAAEGVDHEMMDEMFEFAEDAARSQT